MVDVTKIHVVNTNTFESKRISFNYMFLNDVNHLTKILKNIITCES